MQTRYVLKVQFVYSMSMLCQPVCVVANKSVVNCIATSQIMAQRTLASRSLSHGQAGTQFTALIKLIPFYLLVFPGMISRVLYTGIYIWFLSIMKYMGKLNNCRTM